MDTIDVYFDLDGWAYPGVYTKLGNLPGLNENEKCWTMLGALLVELLDRRYLSVIIYHDSRLVDEWHEDVDFISRRSVGIAARLFNDYVPYFTNLEVRKLDKRTIRSERERLKLV
jgi:hypothetical protein